MEQARISPQRARQAAEHTARLLARDARVRLVYLFGSAADATRAACRDVDVAVLTDKPLSTDERLQLRAEVVGAVHVNVDLVVLNDAPVVLAYEVAETGRCLYARDHDAEVAFVTRARARYWDFKPFVEAQWRLTGERLKERIDGSPA
ncbi:MAG: nucleotidyltransferase domain-containing protein [Deltaproteobacteria bacterium]|nr:nucleotidyltransferase domain-containing protein [Deltaproteobacteria bacterium]